MTNEVTQELENEQETTMNAQETNTNTIPDMYAEEEKEPLHNEELVRDVSLIASDGEVVNTTLDLDEIFFHESMNIRDQKTGYDPKSLRELEGSIRGVGGLLQPLVVTEVEPSSQTDGKTYALVFGFRRALVLRAMAKEEEKWGKNVPVRVISPNSRTGQLVTQFIENEARANLTPLEQSNTIVKLMESADISQQDLAEMLGITKVKVNQYRKLQDLTPAAKKALADEKISFSHARVLLYTVYPNVKGDTPEETTKRWDMILKSAIGKPFGEFEQFCERYKSGSASEAADTSSSASATSLEKRYRMEPAKKVKTVYLPFLQSKASEADDKEKKYTAKDLLEARIDTVETLAGNDETKLAKFIKPFVEAKEKEAEAEAEKEHAGKERKKFMKALIKEAFALFNKVPESVTEQPPSPAQCIATVASETLEKYKTEESRKDLGFPLETDPESLVKELTVYWEEKLEHDRKLREAREKKQKEEEAKKKAEAEKAVEAASGGSD